MHEAGFLPKDSSSVYSDRDGMWHTTIFPSNTPSSRMDAVMLDAWITRALERHQEALNQHPNAKEDLIQSVEGLVPILSIGLHELVRQVTHHCSERGVALDKIWRTYVELFHRVLRQMQHSLREQKQRTVEVQGKLGEVKEELQGLRRSHPEHMHRVIAELEERFTKKTAEYEEELVRCEEENADLKGEMGKHHRELEIWYPGFAHYQDSYIKSLLPANTRADRPTRVQRMRSVRTEKQPRGSWACLEDSEEEEEDVTGDVSNTAAEETAPDVAVAEDFKRLLTVLAPEKRKLIGEDLSFIMDPATTATPAHASKEAGRRPPPGKVWGTKPVAKQDEDEEGAEGGEAEDQEKVSSLKAEVKEQEERIRGLREEILRTEAATAEAALGASGDVEDGQEEQHEEGMGGNRGSDFGISDGIAMEMLRAARRRPTAIRAATREMLAKRGSGSSSSSHSGDTQGS